MTHLSGICVVDFTGWSGICSAKQLLAENVHEIALHVGYSNSRGLLAKLILRSAITCNLHVI
jgi:hypothetical protein